MVCHWADNELLIEVSRWTLWDGPRNVLRISVLAMKTLWAPHGQLKGPLAVFPEWCGSGQWAYWKGLQIPVTSPAHPTPSPDPSSHSHWRLLQRARVLAPGGVRHLPDWGSGRLGTWWWFGAWGGIGPGSVQNQGVYYFQSRANTMPCMTHYQKWHMILRGVLASDPTEEVRGSHNYASRKSLELDFLEVLLSSQTWMT